MGRNGGHALEHAVASAVQSAMRRAMRRAMEGPMVAMVLGGLAGMPAPMARADSGDLVRAAPAPSMPAHERDAKDADAPEDAPEDVSFAANPEDISVATDSDTTDDLDPERPVPPLQEPDDAPFMGSRLDGWRPGRGVRPPERPPLDLTRRVALTAIPQYAAIKVPLSGRESRTRHGGGVSVEADVQLVRWLLLRLAAGTSAHPVGEEFVETDEGARVLAANAGTLLATSVGGSLVYPLDLGRVLPMVDVGGGALFMRAPEGRANGQRGRPCQSDGGCDFGLACTGGGTCEQLPVPQFSVGLSVDVLMGQHWSLGGQFRYLALLSTLSEGANALP